MGQRPFIVVGDQTDHGGVVVEGSMMTDTHGKQIARVGDQVTCPKRNHGTTVIVTGDPTMIIDGKPAARHGDRCACGAILISSQVVSTVSDGGSSNSRVASQGQKAGATASGWIAKLMLQYDDKLVLIDDATGQPLGHAQYAIKRASGELEFGTTDDDGCTHLLRTSVDAVKNVSGVQAPSYLFYDNFTIRGFDAGFATLRNGLQLRDTNEAVNMVFVDHIDVIKGPSSMLYARRCISGVS